MAYGTVKVDAIQSSTKTVQVDDLAASADLGTAAAEDVGTSAGNVVQLDGSARLPAVDGSQLTNLPAAVMDLDGLTDVDLQTAPPADGEALVYDGVSETWIPGAAGATAAGSANEIQYNDGSSGLAASPDLTWDDTAKELGVGGDINLDDGGTYSTTLQMVTATANRVISFPDATGTVALVAGSSSAVQFNSAGALAGDSNFTWSATTGLALGKPLNVNISGAASTPSVSFLGSWFTGGTSTTTKPKLLIEPSGTTSTGWSTSGTGLGINAASGFTGNLLDLQVNGASKFFVTKDGFIRSGASFNVVSDTEVQLRSIATLAWSSSSVGGVSDTFIVRDGAANTLAQRNGTNAQTFRLYNSYTSSTNNERGKLQWASNVFQIGTEKGADGGTARDMELQTDGTTRITLKADGAILFSGLPTSNPAVAGQLWNDGGTLKVSAG